MFLRMCYVEVDSLQLESMNPNGFLDFASYGPGDDTDDSLEGDDADIAEFSGKGSMRFIE